MKTIYLLCICCLLLFSCSVRNNTYVAPLPNTPKFTGAKEAYFNTAASPSHIELQGAFSLTKDVGFTVGRFYGGSDRWSNELGVNLFNKIKSNFYFSTSLGWGQTNIKSHTSELFSSTKRLELAVEYQTLFLQPGAYFAGETEDGYLRAGVFFKYAINKLDKYLYRDYEKYPRSGTIREEDLFTAQPQIFKVITPTLNLEYTLDKVNVGIDLGYNQTSLFNSKYTRTLFIGGQVQQREVKSSFNHFPIILAAYVGIRI